MQSIVLMAYGMFAFVGAVVVVFGHFDASTLTQPNRGFVAITSLMGAMGIVGATLFVIGASSIGILLMLTSVVLLRILVGSQRMRTVDALDAFIDRS